MQKQLHYRYQSKSLATNLVSAIKIFFPALAVFWLFFYTCAKAVPTTKLRGSQSFEVPMPPPGDKSQTLIRKSSEVRRKVILPYHAIIVAGHAVVRLNKMTTAGKVTCHFFLERLQSHLYRAKFLQLWSQRELTLLIRADKSDAAWYLLPYQLNQGFPTIIKSHIQKGIELSKKDVDSILLFSGGQTRKDTGALSIFFEQFCLSLSLSVRCYVTSPWNEVIVWILIVFMIVLIIAITFVPFSSNYRTPFRSC